MKKLKYLLMFSAGSAIIALSSCHKSFDPKSYAPPLSINGYTSASQIASSDLVAHWAFNGDLKDSVSGTAGVNTGTSFANGFEGKGLQGANNAYVESQVPTGIQSVHSFTISVWLKMPENTTGAVEVLGIANPVGFWSDLDIFFDNGATATTGPLKFHVFNNGTSGTGADAWLGAYSVNKPFGGWVNIALTYDDSKSAFMPYYNGSALVSTPVVVAGFAPLNWAGVQKMIFGTFPFQANPSLTSGATAQGWASFNVGEIDEVRFYSRALTSNEVSALVALQGRGK